jgi:ATP-binding cassette subfamily C protein LapB
MTSGSGVFMRVALYAVGAKLVVEGKLTFAALIGSSILGSYAIQKVSALVQIWPTILDAGESRKRLEEFFDLPEQPEGGRTPEEFDASISFKGVKFSYSDGGPLFENLTFDLPAGGRLAVTGYNGSGKTTFCRLLAGLLEPTEGTILAGGIPQEDFDFRWWRHRLIYMPQEPIFLPGTIRENILSGNPDMEQEELNRVTRAAGLRPFLDSSAGGLEMRLGAGGRNLPLGIRKRLALARALAVDGRVAVMDEPGDGLDQEGLRALYEALNEMARQGKTIIVVSHDPKILKAAEYVLDLGVKPTPTFVATGKSTVGREDQ